MTGAYLLAFSASELTCIPIWWPLKKNLSNHPLHKVKPWVSQSVVVFFDKDVIFIKPLMITTLLMKIAFLGGGNAFWKMAEITLLKLLKGGGESPWPLTTSPATNNKYPATWNLSENPTTDKKNCSILINCHTCPVKKSSHRQMQWLYT